MKNKYYYISLKRTHKEDAIFTLWGENSNGYSYDKDFVGLYDKELNNDSVKSVSVDQLEDMFEYHLIDKRVCKVLLNTKENRKALGIRKKDLNRLYPSGYGYLYHKDAYDDIEKVYKINALTSGEVNVFDRDGNSLLRIEKELFANNRDRALYKKISDIAESFFIGRYEGELIDINLSREEFKNICGLW